MNSSATDNVIAALGHSNRVRQVALSGLAGWQLEEILARMQVPFPELTYLRLWSDVETLIPDSFLGGSAPRLRFFDLSGIPFPGLPKLLLSATHLVEFNLYGIPHSGYISPQAMIALLSVLLSLKRLSIGFQSPQSFPGRESRIIPPPKRSTLPALRRLYFKGVTEYLEELVTCIDAPQLDQMHTTFFNQIDFDCPRLARFVNFSPALKERDEAHVRFHDESASVALRYRTSTFTVDDLGINILCRQPDWQLSSIEQVCNFSLHSLPNVEDLYIEDLYWSSAWDNGAIENNLWLELLRPFTAVKDLYISINFEPGIAAALQDLYGDRITEVLPSLQNIFVERLYTSRPFQEDIGQFIAARQLLGRPVAISVSESGAGHGRIND